MNNKNNIKKTIYIGISSILLLLIAVISMKIGSIDITFKELITGILTNNNQDNMGIIRDLRMPRVITAILVGANLAVSGVLLQSIIKNPLADPSVTGISSGASLVTIAIMVLFPSLNNYRVLFGFLGGLLSCIIVYLLAFKKNISPMRIILAGIAVNAMLGGMTTMITIFNGRNSLSVQMWLSGSLATVTWKDVNALFINTLIGLIAAFILFKACNIIILGDKNAKSLGFNADVLRIVISLVAVFLAGISTSIVGIIAFIGLVVPHICRILIGSNHKYLLPFSCIIGAMLLLIADTLGRTIAKPYEIPVGIVMAVIGGPFFLYLLRRSKA
ncbi:FecCD family ABC transporter permease [Clostridium tarantellae]|uniref:Probable heme-iron transport system permease protein IsdF n=1 Tax=Clostridium tarantellae TaxID=39493 RepID=A0A6I1MQ63_9CLOT|nr:iron ABC transporter permease [Clostridium tarantellae]MPQ44277.1 iron chelate uptake ABC transporter family permease subunit [Clostridium tarantellae]